ncbi:unnamed protein product [Brachionus calyciflorus]|uniref:Uncharacterized protein n=1 Tax=Brachionus calyciflorus TaxID=104777 RepID=A0A814HD19_9BILA|nr:unnamed protein product [Brachionus calyciflorus]
MVLNVCGNDVCFGIAAAVNVVDSKTYEEIKQEPKLNQTKRIFYRLVLIDEYSRYPIVKKVKRVHIDRLKLLLINFYLEQELAQFPVVNESLPKLDKDIDKLAAKNNKDAKTKMKVYDAKRFTTKKSSFKIVDAVIVKQTRNDKSYSVYDPNPYRIIRVQWCPSLVRVK